MILLSVSHLRKQYGPEPVLVDVSFDVRPGQRLSLVGPNGAGKTTLLNILSGQEEADAGRFELHGSARLGLLEQHPEFAADRTVWDEVHAALGDLVELAAEAEAAAERLAAATDDEQREAWAEKYDRLQHELHHRDAYQLNHRIERVLDGLGFASSSYRQPVQTLSGGQQNRLLLARLLLEAPDLMLLDEPSNHLDIDATEWLENHLAGSDSRQAMILVSHDRYFLDKVSTQTLELFQGTIEDYAGNYSAYCRQKAERLEVQRRTYERQQVEIAKMEDFVRRNHVGQKHVQAEDRRKKLERIERVPPPREIAVPPMGFPPAARSGDIVLRIQRLAKAYDQRLFDDLTFDVLRGEKWGILGPNGSGKTTLLRCILGRVSPDSGSVTLGSGVRPAYFDQQLACLDAESEVVEAVRPAHKAMEMVEQQRRDLLARFGIYGDMVFQRVESLSGGERNRTALALLAASDANLLMLDEPTNHLDLWARGSLERSLQKFDGTVLLVSHDRYFLNQVVDHLLVVQPGGGFRVIEGNYDTYRHFVARGLADEDRQAMSAAPARNGDAPQRGGRGRKERANQRAREKSARPKRRFPYRKVEELEAEIAECEAKIESLYEQLADPDVLRDGDRVEQTQQQLEQTQAHLAQLYEHWEEASELN